MAKFKDLLIEETDPEFWTPQRTMSRLEWTSKMKIITVVCFLLTGCGWPYCRDVSCELEPEVCETVYLNNIEVKFCKKGERL